MMAPWFALISESTSVLSSAASIERTERLLSVAQFNRDRAEHLGVALCLVPPGLQRKGYNTVWTNFSENGTISQAIASVESACLLRDYVQGLCDSLHTITIFPEGRKLSCIYILQYWDSVDG